MAMNIQRQAALARALNRHYGDCYELYLRGSNDYVADTLNHAVIDFSAIYGLLRDIPMGIDCGDNLVYITRPGDTYGDGTRRAALMILKCAHEHGINPIVIKNRNYVIADIVNIVEHDYRTYGWTFASEEIAAALLT